MSLKQIIATLPNKSPAERTKMRDNAERLLYDPKRQGDAQALLDALDAIETADRQALMDMPDADRVARAFARTPPTETEARLLKVLLDHLGSTSTELTQHLGWGAQSWHMHFGKMCKAREADLWPAEKFGKRDAYFYTGILANFDHDGSRFTMKPGVAVALATLGINGMAK